MSTLGRPRLEDPSKATARKRAYRDRLNQAAERAQANRDQQAQEARAAKAAEDKKNLEMTLAQARRAKYWGDREVPTVPLKPNTRSPTVGGFEHQDKPMPSPMNGQEPHSPSAEVTNIPLPLVTSSLPGLITGLKARGLLDQGEPTDQDIGRALLPLLSAGWQATEPKTTDDPKAAMQVPE